MEFLKGDAGKARILALAIDNLAAFTLVVVALAIVNTSNNVAGATTVLVTYLTYFLVFEALWSRTPGKYFLHLKVCNTDGTRCGFGAALFRTLMRIIEVNPMVGALPAGICVLLTERKQRLGDLLANTVVVSTKM